MKTFEQSAPESDMPPDEEGAQIIELQQMTSDEVKAAFEAVNMEYLALTGRMRAGEEVPESEVKDVTTRWLGLYGRYDRLLPQQGPPEQ